MSEDQAELRRLQRLHSAIQKDSESQRREIARLQGELSQAITERNEAQQRYVQESDEWLKVAVTLDNLKTSNDEMSAELSELRELVSKSNSENAKLVVEISSLTDDLFSIRESRHQIVHDVTRARTLIEGISQSLSGINKWGETRITLEPGLFYRLRSMASSVADHLEGVMSELRADEDDESDSYDM